MKILLGYPEIQPDLCCKRRFLVKRTGKLEFLRPPAFAYHCTAARGAKPALFCESVALERLAACHGTPLYVYSAAMIRERIRAFARAFRSIPHTLCYAVKANSSLAILHLIARAGVGFDVVSGGEIERVLCVDDHAAKRVVFSGVGKTVSEMELALRAGILLFNIESASELEALAETAARVKKQAVIAVRVNPDVSAKTHPYISTGLYGHKFGVPIPEAWTLYSKAAKQPYLKVAGVSVHIGSQITDVSSFTDALEPVADLVRALRTQGYDIRYVDAGGGLGISYEGDAENPAQRISAYARAVLKPLRRLNAHLLLEPGRSIVGPAGVLLTRAIYRKTNGRKRFLIVDAAMNDLLRPSLYRAYHDIVPVTRSAEGTEITDVVGPICETGDFFARHRELPVVRQGNLLAILDTGAYGAVLGSNYNARGKAAEVLVDSAKARVIRDRESIQAQMRLERV
jgi:diaminopimelate decarboxylase